MKTSQRHAIIRKLLCILTIPKSKINLALKMTMARNSFRKQRPDGPLESTLQHKKPQHIQNGQSVRKASQCTGFHTARVLIKRHLRTDISIVIIATLLGRLFADLVLVFGVTIRQVVFYIMSTFAYFFGTFV